MRSEPSAPGRLPDLIELVPIQGPVNTRLQVPGSKSVTNRALVLAALNATSTELRGALWSEDTQVMVEALQVLGFSVDVDDDPEEPANRIIRVTGLGGRVPPGGTRENPLDLFVGNAGTAARFLAALVCLGTGWYRLHGVPRMHERPQGALFQALRELGYGVHSERDRLPVLIEGTGPRAARCRVAVDESSQFASALLLAGAHGGWNVEVTGADPEELPYVEMTRQLVSVFPPNGGVFQVEPDASSGSYFWGADWLVRSSFETGGVEVLHWPESGWQVDAAFPRYLPLQGVISRQTDLGDSIMTGIVLAPLMEKPVHFTDLGRLRVQECERVAALRTELTKCGAIIREIGDTLQIEPTPLHGAVIETYNDHRMAMCFAILGLKVPGIKIQNPSCVKKTFPNFFQKLAEAPPRGLGVVILDKEGQRLSREMLFAG